MSDKNESEAWFTKQPGGITVLPNTINGWLVLIVFAIVIGLIIKMENSGVLSDTVGTLTGVLVTLIFTIICFKKSE